MPLNIPVGYYNVAFHYTYPVTNKVAVNTLGFQYTGADFEGDASDLANSWGTEIMAAINDDVVLDHVTFAVAEGVVLDLDVNFPGGGSGDGMTPNVAYLIKKSTSAPGRHNRGRLYLPGCDETAVNAQGVVLPAKVTSINTQLVNFLLAATSANFIAQILHNTILAPTPVNALYCQTLVATQRRRLR